MQSTDDIPDALYDSILEDDTEDLPDAFYDSILEYDTEGDFFFDALEDVGLSPDAHIDIGDHTFFLEDPFTPFSFLTQGTTDDHDNSFMKYVCDLRIYLW